MIKKLGASKATTDINTKKSKEPCSHQVEAARLIFISNMDICPSRVHVKSV